jgi:iron complex outermembrane recepter protein
MKKILQKLIIEQKIFLLVVCFMFISNVLIAQKITGKISNQKGEGLSGVSVLIKNSNKGTVSDAGGNYAIEASQGNILVFTSVGFEKKEVKVTSQASVNVSMTETAESLDEVVVTGVFDARTRMESSTAISVMKTKDIERVAATSGMDYLKNVSGVFVSAGRGEIGNQVGVRGLFQPFSASALNYFSIQEDGLPISNINFGVDYYLRPDVTTSRIEALRGGSASITAPNAPGGIFNYISKTGGDKLEGEARAKFGLEGDGKNPYYRADFGIGGPLSADKSWRFYVGGFYRDSQGSRYAGYSANDGGQLKLNLTKTYRTGSLKIYGKILSDKNQQIAFTPSQGWANQDIPDGFSYTASYDVPSLQFQIPRNGKMIDFDTRNKYFSREKNIGLSWTQELGKGLTLRVASKFSDRKFLQQDTQIASTIDPTTAGFYGLPSLSGRFGTFTFTDLVTGQALGTFTKLAGQAITAGANNNFPGINNKVMFMPAFMTERNGTDFMNQISLSKQTKTMKFIAGAFFASTNLSIDGMSTGSGPGAATIQDRPHLIDIKLASVDGKTYQVTSPQGFMKLDEAGQNTGYADQSAMSLYFGHEWEITSKLNLDWGIRSENIVNTGWNATTIPTNGADAATFGGTDGNPLTLYDNFGGVPNTQINYSKTSNYLSFSAGLNYRLSQNQAVYFRYSNGGKSPDINALVQLNSQFVADNTDEKKLTQGVQQIEFSYKYSSPTFKLFITPFMSKLSNVLNTQFFRNVDGSAYTAPLQFNSFTTKGVEIESELKLGKVFGIKASAVIQESIADQYTTWIANANGPQDDVLLNFSGNKNAGVPPVMLNIAPSLSLGKLYAMLSFNYLSPRPANIPNGWEMKGYNNVDLSANYAVNNKVSLQFNITNLLNQAGVLEWYAPGNFPANLGRDAITPAYVAANPNSSFSTLRNMPRAFFWTLSYKF